MAATFPVGPSEALGALRQPSAGSVTLIAGDFATRLWGVHANFIRSQHVVLATGGPGLLRRDYAEATAELRAIALTLVDALEYAFIAVDPNLRDLIYYNRYPERSQRTWTMSRDTLVGASFEAIDDLCDDYVLDAFPWQLLGPGHTARLSRPGFPPSPQPVFRLHPVAGDRTELTIGEFTEWTYGRPEREPVYRAAGEALGPCLLMHPEATEI